MGVIVCSGLRKMLTACFLLLLNLIINGEASPQERKLFTSLPTPIIKNLKMVSKSRVTSVTIFQKLLFKECSFASDGNLKRNLLIILRHVFN